jgi:hypothetical protein
VAPVSPFAPTGPVGPIGPTGPVWPFWFQVICVSRLLHLLWNDELGRDGSINRIVPVTFSLQAV